MPHATETARRLREVKRARILEAAGHVFARKGLGATMDDVATEAGVSHGLAYRYFASKEALIAELVTEALRDQAAVPRRFRELSGTPGERLRALLAASVESRRDPTFYWLADHVLGSERAPEELRGLVRERSRALRDGLRGLIVAGQATGEVVAGDPDQLVRAVFACLDGLTRPVAYDPEHDRDHFPDAEIFLRMLKP